MNWPIGTYFVGARKARHHDIYEAPTSVGGASATFTRNSIGRRIGDEKWIQRAGSL